MDGGVMLRVLIELWPGGDSSRAKSIGEAEIVNVGGDAETGDYHVRLLRGSDRQTWKTGRVIGFRRLERGAWELLYRAIASVVEDGEPASTVEALRRPHTTALSSGYTRAQYAEAVHAAHAALHDASEATTAENRQAAIDRAHEALHDVYSSCGPEPIQCGALESEVQAVVGEFMARLQTPMPCGHKLEDLVYGAKAVTKCGACLWEMADGKRSPAARLEGGLAGRPARPGDGDET
jgi:hypothetical protein